MGLSELTDAVNNALLFAGDPKSASGGLIKLSRSVENEVILVEAYDDHTYVRTRVLCPEFPQEEWFLQGTKVRLALKEEDLLEALRALERWSDPGVFGSASEMMTQPTAMTDGFYFSVDRWKKLGSLKPSGEVMHFRTHNDGGFPYGSFQYGGNTIGLVSFLDRDVLEEEGMI